MERTLSLRKRIVAALLAVVMVMGFWVMGASAANADPTGSATEPAGVGVTPTGNERIENPEEPVNPKVPRGGLFRFESEDFLPGTKVYLQLNYTGGYGNLGTFTVDGSGSLTPVITTEPYASVIIPTQAAVGTATINAFYSDGTWATGYEITVLDNPYTANFEIDVVFANSLYYLHVVSTSNFGPNREIFVKIDYLEAPVWGSFTTDANGDFNAMVPLRVTGYPDPAPGIHAFTLLSPDQGNLPRLSLSQNLSI